MSGLGVMERGTRLRLKLHAMGRLGEALGHHDGKQVFVFGGIPGEEVVAEVVREHRHYIAARVVEVVDSSPNRVEAPCPYFGPCNGCQWQHIDYQHQLEMKRALVVDAFQRVAGMAEAPVAPVLPAPIPLDYRNHARFTVGPEGALGFVNRESRSFVPIQRCMLMHPWINGALEQLQGHCQETTQVSIRYGINTGSWLVQPTLQNPDIPLASGQKHYQEALQGRSFQIAASSFFQVNTTQAEQLVDLVRERLHLTGRELLVDAYAGVGTFAALLAPLARRTIAIEESASALDDASANLHGGENVEVWREKTEVALSRMEEAPDAIILDPPRTGCHPRTLEALLRLAPQRVVYISCDPGTLARDVKVLCQGPFHLEEVQPVDMFPQTHHVECVATLSLKGEEQRRWKGSHLLILASSSPRRHEILASMGLEFQVMPSPEEESQVSGPTPEELAQRRALAKAQWTAERAKTGVVIGADTLVVDGEQVLGKPRSREEARAMLRRLRGRDHRVITGVAVVNGVGGEALTEHRTTEVRMREYTDEEIETYISSGEPWDKAGGYGVQDPLLRPAARIRGCYLNVVGLPPCTLLTLLSRLGLSVRPGPQWDPPGECPDCRRWIQPPGGG